MSLSVCHISATPNWKSCVANWGDKALVYATQKQFNDYFGEISWTNLDCRKIYTQRDVDLMNAHDFIVVGGGGLILPDTFKNNVSGWQWGISADLIKKIKVPLIVYSIGWNLFPGQKNNDAVLVDNLKALSEKSAFLSLRHMGDVELFNAYVPGGKAILNYCPTMAMDSFRAKRSKRIGFNIAGDRPDIRYGNRDNIFKKLLNVLEHFKRQGYEPVIINHMPLDSPFGEYVNCHTHIDVFDMSSMTVGEGIDFYHTVEYMFATRGHSQMIPFGLGAKVISLVSHPKLNRFLDDICALESSVNINAPGLDRLCMQSLGVVDGFDWGDRCEHVIDSIADNMLKIKGIISGSN